MFWRKTKPEANTWATGVAVACPTKPCPTCQAPMPIVTFEQRCPRCQSKVAASSSCSGGCSGCELGK